MPLDGVLLTLIGKAELGGGGSGAEPKYNLPQYRTPFWKEQVDKVTLPNPEGRQLNILKFEWRDSPVFHTPKSARSTS